MYGVLKCEYGSVSRAVASVAQSKERSLLLAVLIRRILRGFNDPAGRSLSFIFRQ